MRAAPADDRGVIGDRLDRLFGMPDEASVPAASGNGLDPAAIANVIDDLRPLELPGIAERKPFLRIFLLPAIPDDLAEEPMVVAYAVAAGGNAQARHAFEKAGGKPAEAAIAERRVGLGEAHPVEVDAEIAQRPVYDIAQLQIAGDIVEQAADEKLERQVIDALAAAGEVVAVGSQPAVDHPIAQ